jgi:O-antigen/teichoic acid export membrane protein
MKLKKNTFIQGAFIATMGIVISKILGIIYVIPFHAIIGEQGGALYGYAYNIYSIFLGISQAGVPLAMSRLISEYNTLGYYGDKEQIFKVGRTFLNIVGIICFLVLFFFAPQIADLIIGGVTDGNSPEDIAFVIRVISTAILIVPILSISRGYLQGHRFIAPTSTSQVIEQVVRVVIIIIGSYVSVKVLHLPLSIAVGCAVFAATLGAISSYLYLRVKIKKNKKELNTESVCKEPKLTTMDIMKMIMIYAVPLILIELFRSIYNSVDIVTLVRTLHDDFGFVTKDAEAVMSYISTYGAKLNNIIISVVAGLMTSLIPNLTRSIVKNDKKDINAKINQTFQLILGISLPMSIGLSFLTDLVWNVFYGASKYGPVTFKILVFVAFATTVFSACMTVSQLLKEYKVVYGGLVLGFLFKLFLNIPMMHLFNDLGLLPFYGSITTSILGFFISSLLCLTYCAIKYKINLMPTLKVGGKIFIGVSLMVGSMYLLHVFGLPLSIKNRMISLAIAIFYAAVGGIVYLLFMQFTNSLVDIFGKENVDRIKKKLSKFNLR